MLYVTPEVLDIFRRQQILADARQAEKEAIRVRRRLRSVNKDRLRELVDRAARILSAGGPSKFEYEGACRHGFRVAFIRKGWAWADADGMALQIVAKALHQIGAERPGWDEGQPDFISAAGTQRYFCAQCGGKIDEERRAFNGGGYRQVKYCSDLCSHAAYERKARLSGEAVSRAQYLAECAERSGRTIEERTRDCALCRKPYIAATVLQEFCSPVCSAGAMRKSAERSCAGCGKTYSANKANAARSKYCSHTCYAETASRLSVDTQQKTCVGCGIEYSISGGNAARSKYCGHECYAAPSRLRKFTTPCVPDLIQ